jgi:histidinol-phosphate/aromatic aminotransferase/cobyric acid decarboxylase-like protein
MQIWVGPNFREDSMTNQTEFLEKTFKERNISIYVIHSWTKIWSCTGLRLGSIVCPTVSHCVELKRIQVPWSVNSPALAFLDEVVRDKEYLEETWRVTPIYRAQLIERLEALGGGRGWEYFGKSYLSWVWADMKDVAVAEKAVELAKAAGVPVRSGKPGYERPTFVRIAVREPKQTDILLNAWKNL